MANNTNGNNIQERECEILPTTLANKVTSAISDDAFHLHAAISLPRTAFLHHVSVLKPGTS